MRASFACRALLGLTLGANIAAVQSPAFGATDPVGSGEDESGM